MPVPVPEQGLAAQALAAGLVQPDPTTCGSSVLVAVRVIDDPAYASFLVNGVDSLTGRQQGGSLADRFRDEALAMHRRTNRFLDARGRPQLPWPRALGTLPWSVARELTSTTGTTYDAQLVLPFQRPRAFDRVATTVAAGRAVPVFVGNRLSARHVVLAIETLPDGVLIYDPASGRRYPITRDDWVHGRLAVAGWRVPWFVVVPKSG